MIKCPVCGAELTPELPFCPICGASLSFPFRPILAGVVFLGLCWLALHFIPTPYAYLVAAPLVLLSLLPLGYAGFWIFRRLLG